MHTDKKISYRNFKYSKPIILSSPTTPTKKLCHNTILFFIFYMPSKTV